MEPLHHKDCEYTIAFDLQNDYALGSVIVIIIPE